LDDVYYGLYESNGSFSALEKQEKICTLPVLLIDDGNLDKGNLDIAGITKESLKAFLKEQNTTLKKVLVMTVDGNGRVYFQQKFKPYKILQIEVAKKW
jgi:uncharacterized membrane protein YcaP (DUF421 family)